MDAFQKGSTSRGAFLTQSRFLRACRGLPVDATPVWIMRQAGRYLPEYREIRRKADFLTLCKTPHLAALATATAAEALGTDAAIIFSDILLPLEAAGMKLMFEEPGGPRLPEPVQRPSDIRRLALPDLKETMGYLDEAVKQTLRLLGDGVPLIGFAGAPFTLAAYAIEGGTSKNYARTLAWLHRDPASFCELLDRLAQLALAVLELQVSAGVHAVQIFDSWGGLLSRDDYRRHAAPRVQRIVQTLRPSDVPVILYVNGSSHLLEAMAETGAHVLSVDWRLPLDEVRRRVGPGAALQGNLDPCVLFAGDEAIANAVHRVLDAAGPTGHILNLGHGILPDTPVEGARAMIRACHAHRQPERPRGTATGSPEVKTAEPGPSARTHPPADAPASSGGSHLP
jgi:uroporphyrinogen decarboxylase